MRDQFELATTVPHDEPCVQIGEENYSKWSRLEANTLIDQLTRQLGEPPSSTYFKVISCPHDFGVYYDIALVSNDSVEESGEYMLKVESEMPSNWDEECRKKLKEAGYPIGEYNEELR